MELSDLYLILGRDDIKNNSCTDQYEIARFVQEVLIMNNCVDTDVSGSVFYYDNDNADVYIDFDRTIDDYKCTLSVINPSCILIRYQYGDDDCDFHIMYSGDYDNKELKSNISKYIINKYNEGKD